MVSVPSGHFYEFPRKMHLEYHLKDFLQQHPEEKYFLSQRMIDFFIANTEKQKLNGNGFTFDPIDEEDNERIGKTITTRAGSRMDDNFVKIKNCNSQGYALATNGDGIDISGRMQFHRGTVQKGCSQTLSTMGGNDVGVCVFSDIEKELFTEDGNIRRYIGSEKIDEFKEGQMATTTYPNGYAHGPRTHNESIALNTVDRPVVKQNLKIRKLTPTECMRLMGFNDDATNSMKEMGMTDNQIYHVAGDSIVVSVLMGIFGKLIGIDYEPKIRELAKRLAESK